MQDDEIVALYWQRDEAAIRETEQKYGRYLSRITYNVLADLGDCEEVVNDICLKAWNSMPPHRPAVLRTYLGKIARQLSIDRFRTRNREKRQGSEYSLSLSELEECVSGGDATQQAVDGHLLAEAISAYLKALPEQARHTFVGRYYYMDPLKEVAAYCGMSQSKAKSLLYRTRQGLKAYLKQEGFDL